jgi:tetratricopeptide (TPR) repeat protein
METLNSLIGPISVTATTDSPDKQKGHQAVFYQTRQYFGNYFLNYALDHRSDWSWLEAEHTNLMAATRSCLENNDYPNLLAFRNALQSYLDLQGHWADSLRLNEWAIAAAQACDDHSSLARFTHDRADILNQLGEYHQAANLYQTSEQIYLSLGEKRMALHSRHMRALVVRAQGQLAEAERLCASTIADAQRLELHIWLAHPLYVQALLARDRGNFRQARRYIEDGLARLADSDELAMVAQCRHFLGELAFLQGHLTDARAQVEESLRLSQAVGVLRRVAATQRLLGDIVRAEGNYAEADKLYRETFEIVSKLGDQPQQARVLLSRAQLLVRLNLKQEAMVLFQNALAIYQKIGDRRGETTASLLLTQLYLKWGDFRLALSQGMTALKVSWAARLLRPSIIIGILKRNSNW